MKLYDAQEMTVAPLLSSVILRNNVSKTMFQ